MSENLYILSEIQSKLKAPKNQLNTFGNYYYRNCEDILEALKPFLYPYGCTVVISDEIVLIGERYYIKATAQLKQGTQVIDSASAYAREAENKKGMDEAQVTGAASSYARKYALNGLFAIEDTKDPDANGKKEEKQQKKDNTKKDTQNESLTDVQMKKFRALIGEHEELTNKEKNEVYTWIKQNKAETISIDGKDVITKKSASDIIENFDKYFAEWIEFKASNPPE